MSEIHTCDRCERSSKRAAPVQGIRTKDPGSTTWRPFFSCCGLHRTAHAPRTKLPLLPYQAAAMERGRTATGREIDPA